MNTKLPIFKILLITGLFASLSSFTNAQEEGAPLPTQEATPNLISTPETNSQIGKTGLTYSPTIIELDLKPGKTYLELIKLRNEGEITETYYPQALDFVARGEEGGQEFIAPETGNTAYSLASWVKYPTDQIVLAPGEDTAFTISIVVPTNAEPGGKYAGLLLSTRSVLDVNTSGTAISTMTGPIILGAIEGQQVENLTVDEFGVNKDYFEYIPAEFSIRLQNTGNIHVKPYGVVEIKNMFGAVTTTLPVNPKLGNVLPNSFRKFDVAWDDNSFRIGQYSAQLKLTYGTDRQLTSAIVSFWVIPWKVLLIGLLALIAFIAMLRFVLHRYNEMIIKNALKLREKEDQKNTDSTAKSSKSQSTKLDE